MYTVNNISIHFTGEDLFTGITFIINERDKIGLVGKNGSGKTTLMRIISGQMSAETGSIIIPEGKTVSYLAQELVPSDKLSVFAEAMTAFKYIDDLQIQREQLLKELAEREDYESDGYTKLLYILSDIDDKLSLTNHESFEGEAEKVLIGLGFKPSDFPRSMAEFSTGWQMRVELAKLLLQSPDLLLLDEPTNHLDIDSIQWLEGFLSQFRGAVILVSHDRAFLDNVTKRTIEIAKGKIYDYKTNYSNYVQQREERIEHQRAAFNNQQNEIAEIEKFIERFRYKASKSRQAQSRIKMLEKMERIEVDDKDNSAIRFRFPPAPNSGNIVIEATNISKSYDSLNVLKNIDLLITKGEKIAFVGRNGEGKTTLTKVILGLLDYKGECKLGANVTVGYYAQNQAASLDLNKTVFQTIDDIATGDMRTRVKSILGGFLFQGEDIDKKVSVLSGGEKGRLALAQLLLKPHNLLILDEPTNHLDMVSKDVLKSALLQYEGTLIVVSHDRDFLDGLTDKVFEFKDKKIKPFIGGIYEFIQSRNLESLQQLEKKNSDRGKNSLNDTSLNKTEYEQRKHSEKELRKIEAQIRKYESEIERIEREMEQLQTVLSDPINNSKLIQEKGLYKKFKSLEDELILQMEKWEAIQKQSK